MLPVSFVNKERDQLPRETGERGLRALERVGKSCSEAQRGARWSGEEPVEGRGQGTQWLLLSMGGCSSPGWKPGWQQLH